MSAIIKICQIEEPQHRKEILDIIHTEADALPELHEVSLYVDAATGHWDLIIKSMEDSELCRSIPAVDGTVEPDRFRAIFRELLMQFLDTGYDI